MPDLSYVLDFNSFVEDFREAQEAHKKAPTMTSQSTFECEYSLDSAGMLHPDSPDISQLYEPMMTPLLHASGSEGTVSPAVEPENVSTTHIEAIGGGGQHFTFASIPLDATPSLRPPRKGHRKSRQGCFNCKRRKIKCQETQPACENCTRKKIDCVYPKPKTLSALRISSSYSATSVNKINLQPTPMIFTLTDMRLFHHYLTAAYPHLPVGNDNAWTNQVPLIAHHTEYLMHAVLGLAASHLQLITGQDLTSVAMYHRVLAIQGSNMAISKKDRTGADGDALLGSCYALTFQSSYMSDGMADFFYMVHGCSMLTYQLKGEGIPMAFFLDKIDHFEFMKGRLMDLPEIHKELVDSCEISLTALPVLFNRPEHVEFYKSLLDVVDAMKISSLKVYFNFVKVYQSFNKMTMQEIGDFTNPSNHISRLLLAHFLALQMIVTPILNREWSHRSRPTPIVTGVQWVDTIHRDLRPDLQKHLEWPQYIAHRVSNELNGSLTPTISILKKGEGLSKDII